MEALDFDAVHSEEKKPLLRYTHFSSITKLFRIVEIFLGIVFISWTSTRLPLVVKIAGEYFRHLVSIIFSPLFIFLLSNLIVLTLLFKAGHILSGAQSPTLVSSESETETDLYEEFIKTADDCTKITSLISSPGEIEYEDKLTIFEVSSTVEIGNSDASEVVETVFDKPTEMKAYSRSQSENFYLKSVCVEEEENIRGKLRRSGTEKCRKIANPGEVPVETVYIFDELSNEEFQQTIEAFIAKQIKFHRQEKL